MVDIAGILAGRHITVTALVREKVPPDLTVFKMLIESDELIVVCIQILRILMAAPFVLGGLVGRQLMPLLAGDLATATGGASGCINQKRLRHDGLLFR